MKDLDKNVILAPEKMPQQASKDTDVIMEGIKARLIETNPDANTDMVEIAYRFAKSLHKGQKRKSGDPYIIHPVEVAYIAAQLSLDNGVGKGRGRSVGNFNLFDALSACETVLTTFGGHAMAAGLAINEEKIAEFDAMINKYAKDNLKPDDLVPIVKIDCMLAGQQLNLATSKLISTLEPFGMGNETPVFAVKDVTVLSITSVGADKKHLRMQVVKDGVKINAIGFGLGEFTGIINSGDVVHLACKLDVNKYQGNETAQLVIVDIKKKTD